MKLTNGDIFGAQESLRKLIEQKFPVMVSYKLSKLAAKLNEQLKVIEEVRMGLVRKYGETDDKSRNLAVKRDGANWDKFVEEFNELLSQEVEIVVEKVKLPEKTATTCDKCNHNMDTSFVIEPTVLMALDKFVEV